MNQEEDSQLKVILTTVEKIETQIEEISARTKDHERTLYGHEDSRRRPSEPGLVEVVGELAAAFKDVRAVAKAGWAMLTLVGFSTVISLISLLMG